MNHRAVALVREEWRVVDRWWTEEPVVRGYFELVLESGGSWRRTLTLREPSADSDRIRVALSPRLTELPAPVAELRLELVELTEPTGHQLELLAAGAEDRSRLRDGLRQVRARDRKSVV